MDGRCTSDNCRLAATRKSAESSQATTGRTTSCCAMRHNPDFGITPLCRYRHNGHGPVKRGPVAFRFPPAAKLFSAPPQAGETAHVQRCAARLAAYFASCSRPRGRAGRAGARRGHRARACHRGHGGRAVPRSAPDDGVLDVSGPPATIPASLRSRRWSAIWRPFCRGSAVAQPISRGFWRHGRWRFADRSLTPQRFELAQSRLSAWRLSRYR
jgi:hypothetical protein